MTATYTKTKRSIKSLNDAIENNPPQLIELDGILINQSYQRSYYEAAHPINRNELEPDLFGTIHVSIFEGNVYCWEGQHRVLRAINAGITHLWGFVDNRNIEEQAGMFVRMQIGRKPLKKWETFKGQLAAKDPDAMAIAEALRKGGNLKIGSDGKTSIKAVAAVEKVYFEYGKDMLQKVAQTITQLWPGESEAWVGSMWPGMAAFLSEHVVTDRMFENLRHALPDRIVKRAQMIAAEATKGGFTTQQSSAKYVSDELLRVARRRK